MGAVLTVVVTSSAFPTVVQQASAEGPQPDPLLGAQQPLAQSSVLVPSRTCTMPLEDLARTTAGSPRREMLVDAQHESAGLRRAAGEVLVDPLFRSREDFGGGGQQDSWPRARRARHRQPRDCSLAAYFSRVERVCRSQGLSSGLSSAVHASLEADVGASDVTGI